MNHGLVYESDIHFQDETDLREELDFGRAPGRPPHPPGHSLNPLSFWGKIWNCPALPLSTPHPVWDAEERSQRTDLKPLLRKKRMILERTQKGLQSEAGTGRRGRGIVLARGCGLVTCRWGGKGASQEVGLEDEWTLASPHLELRPGAGEPWLGAHGGCTGPG